MQSSKLDNLKMQLTALEIRFASAKPSNPDGKWNKTYFALKGKIAVLKAKIEAERWEEFLAQ